MTDIEYFSHLYEIASHLNREYSLPSALRKSLEKTVELLDLETGWIWLVQGDRKSVYLAASYNLPPALSDHPERLSGWCYCIQKYLSDGISEARNISEITCSRLKDLTSGTRDLKYHATIPITLAGQKVGLINLVSRETQQMGEKQLSILNTISELIGIAVQRTRLQDSHGFDNDSPVYDVLDRVILPRIKKLASDVGDLQSYAEQKDLASVLRHVRESYEQVQELLHHVTLIRKESQDHHAVKSADSSFHYPASPLTARELEVLALVRRGHTNSQVAEQLFISERTVKFHITSILSKLYAKTRTEAVDTALKRGLLSP
ncbi:MAG TPA: LuxR C-terminal-related transcriptional regulator [Cyclobacteriaceae bacterium]